ncbi:hypothetical protein BJ741DRAFT_679527 [Chytriomyces cf. hyalinus JEL632]|nr:hypothetical protein BJ741DRAFT_679527 [Chytriomyces cf. hyalinus JEL632]
MHLLNLSFEVLLKVFLRLDPFKTGQYRRAYRSINNLLTGPPFSQLIGLVHLGHIHNALKNELSDIFCFVTPASFRKDFLRRVQQSYKSPLKTPNDFKVLPLKRSNATSLLECLPSEVNRESESFFYGCSTIGSLKQLKSLELRDHKLSGPIPRSLGDLKALTNLNLMGNRMTGPILEELCNLVNLRNLHLAGTLLDETIPESIGNLVNLEVLSMSGGRLSGPIPASIGNLVNLVELSLSFQVSLGQCMQLTTFDGKRNNFNGSIHESILRMPLLRYWRLESNYLTWEISPSWSVSAQPVRMETAQLEKSVNVASDRESGTTIRSASASLDLQSDDIASNQLKGDSFASTTDGPPLLLKLSQNELSGGIPACITSLSNLQRLILCEYQLSEPLPTEIGRSAKLEILSLGNNQISELARWQNPISITSLANLTTLSLEHNKLSGRLPTEIGFLNSPQFLNLSHNQLCGELPESIANLTALGTLNLSHNSFYGEIPESIGNLRHTWMLDLSDNELSGEIPPRIYKLSNQCTLHLHNNSLLTGSELESFLRLPLRLLTPSNEAMYDLPIEILLEIFLQLDPFTVAKYRRVCHSLNTALTAHPFSHLISLVHIRHTQFEGGGKGHVFCFVTPASFGERFLTSVQNSISTRPGVFEKYPVNALNAIPINLLTATSETSLFKSFPYLASVYTGYLRFAGPLPSAIGNLTQLIQHFQVDQSSSFVDIESQPQPTYWRDSAWNLHDHQSLMGSFHGDIGALKTMQTLDLSHNQLTGSVPTSMLKRADILKLGRNGPWLGPTTREEPECVPTMHPSLFGDRQRNMEDMAHLKNLNLSHNQLCGPIFPSIFSDGYIECLNLSNNCFNVTLPRASFMKQIKTLDLSNNQFEGSVLRSLAHCRRLKLLDLSRKDFEGDLPKYFRSQSGDKPVIPFRWEGESKYQLLNSARADSEESE